MNNTSPGKRSSNSSAKKAKKKTSTYEEDFDDEDSPGSPAPVEVEQFEFEDNENICNSIVQEESKTPDPKKTPSEHSQSNGPRMQMQVINPGDI